MLPAAPSDADKSPDFSLTPRSWVSSVSESIPGEIILSCLQPLSALNIIITLLSFPTSRAFRICTVTFELVKKNNNICPPSWVFCVLPSPPACPFFSPPLSARSRGNLHTWANDHIMDSLVGSQWLPITVVSWSQKTVLKKAKKKILIRLQPRTRRHPPL